MSRRDDDHVGYPIGDPRDDGAETLREAPLDLAAVQADDALLDMLGCGGPTSGDVDGELASVLVAWRRDVHAESIKELVDTDTAVAVIKAARRPSHSRNPVLGPIAAAAAVLVIAFSGTGLVAKSAQPGDQLWGLTQVLYTDYARSVEAAALVRNELDEANTAMREGKTTEARAYLERAHQQLPAIAEAEGRTDLAARHDQLEKMLNGTNRNQTQDTGPSVLPPVLPVPPTSSTAPATTTTATTERSVDDSPSPSPSPTASPSSSEEPSGSPRRVPDPPVSPVSSGTDPPSIPEPSN